jgi:hypothetical protein
MIFTDITDTLAMKEYETINEINIYHSCDGTAKYTGKYYGGPCGDITKNYMCDNCGYKLNDSERFMVKILAFNMKITLLSEPPIKS